MVSMRGSLRGDGTAEEGGPVVSRSGARERETPAIASALPSPALSLRAAPRHDQLDRVLSYRPYNVTRAMKVRERT